MDNFTLALIASFVAAAATVAGAFLIPKKIYHTLAVNYLISLAAGFMLSVAILEMMPESLELSKKAPLFLVIGFFVAHLFEHVISPHFHFGEETHPEMMVSFINASAAFFGLSMHSLFDGVSLGSGFIISAPVGWLIFLAIFFHKLPEGFTISSLVIVSGKSKKYSIIAASLIGSITILGFFIAFLLKDLIYMALPFSAGITLYVAASDLIPLINNFKGIKYSILLFSGIILYYLLHLLLHSLKI